jgi:glycosyltransferase involved in cell wall biosynthesis
MINGEAKVSIVIPFKDRPDYLKETLQSVIDQTYQYWECLIINDGSSENYIQQIKVFIHSEPRFILLNNQGRGAAAARNEGIKVAQGDYLIFLDSDDLLAPFCLKQRIEKLKVNPELDFAVFPMLLFFEKPYDSDLLWNIETKDIDIQRFARLDAVWQTTGPIWRKEAIKKIGGFDEELLCWQDVDFHLKALASGLNYQKFYQKQPDCFYRKQSKNSISQQEINSLPKLKSRFKVLEKLIQLDLGGDFVAKNIIISAARSYKISTSIMVLKYSIRQGILKRNEINKLILLIFLFFIKLNKFFNIPYFGLLKSDYSNIGKHLYITGQLKKYE